MTPIERIIQTLCGSYRVRVHPPTTQPELPAQFPPPQKLVEFYGLCGGVDFLDPEDRGYARYRILPPQKVVDIGTATCRDPATEPPLNAWFVVGEDDNGEHAAIDLHPSRSGQCYDVFHETYDDPAYARIVAATFEEFLARLFERGRSYWFDDGFVSRYFDGGTQAAD
jgi:hypothetical protein